MGGPSFGQTLNPLHQMILCAKFGGDWSSGSGEEDENVQSLQKDGLTMRSSFQLSGFRLFSSFY